MDIVVWLRSLGLGKYEAVFRENDIDETVLPSLTHENLKELGVASFGHRVKLLDAIAALRKDVNVQTPSVMSKKLGDGLMALFGYPVAQENDAERAARAALSIQRSLGDINRKNAGSGKPALKARIGIETGPVVVDPAGEIYGDAPNTAARVQALAEPGTVLVTAQVQ